MPDFYQKIQEDQGAVEDLIRKIPGFKGYFEKQDRRGADRLLREYLVRVFEEQLGAFTSLQRDLIDSPGGIMQMERVQNITTKLQTFIDRIGSAAQGYAGLFDATKVDQDDLARLYAFDNGLLQYQAQFGEGLGAFEAAIGNDEVDMKNVLRQLDSIVTEANDMFKRRTEAMQGLQDSV
jgi:hypothetical protein